MKGKHVAFTLVGLPVAMATVVLLIGIAGTSLSRVRELSKRSVCGLNLLGIGAAAKVYAGSNNDRWMVPPFKRGNIDKDGIDYGPDLPGTRVPPADPGEVGWFRERQSTSETTSFPNAGSTALSVTRAFWMLVRSGDITVQQFICPSSGDQTDQTENLDLYYDFTKIGTISYGFQVPFGPRDTRPREGMDNRQILAADKGPFYTSSFSPNWNVGASGGGISLEDSPKAWRSFNSPNHGGRGGGEGQNCLFADGHASFQRIPAVGIDNDNIYTHMTDEWSLVNPPGENRIHGDTAFTSPLRWLYPGQNAFFSGRGGFASTDSLIYP